MSRSTEGEAAGRGRGRGVRRIARAVAPRLVGLLLLATPFAPALLVILGAPRAADALDLAWAPICQRLPERTLDFLGAPMPMCSRCFGIVVGLGLGLVVAWPVLPPRRLLAVVGAAALFLVVELVTQDLGLHRVFHPTRLLSGLLLAYPIGAAAGALALGRIAPDESPDFRPLPKNRRG